MNDSQQGGGGGGGSPGGPQENPVVTWYEEWAARTPIMTRWTLQTLVGFYILSFFIATDAVAANVPYFTLYHLEIYRVVLCVLFPGSFISLLFVLFSFTGMATRLENSLGSTYFLYLMLLLATSSNLLFIVICVLISFTGSPEAMMYSAQGFWLILMALIAIECHASGMATRSLFIPSLQIPSLYYPLALLGIFSLLLGFRLDLCVATGVGYLYAYGYLDSLKLSPTQIQSWETGLLSAAARQPGFVLQSAAMGGSAWATGDSAQQAQGGGAGFSSFLGGQQQQPGQQPGGGQPGQDGGAGGGRFGGFGGFGANAGGASGGAGGGAQQQQTFPGSGQRLGSNGAGSAGSIQSEPAQGSSEAQRAQMERAANLRQLQQLGYSPEDSANALDTADGDFQTALDLLAA